MDVREKIAIDLEDARRRTEALLAPVDDERLTMQHDRLMSPLVWDYAHIGVQEELWLVNRLSGTHSNPINEQYMHMYDAFENPRAKRIELPLMNRQETGVYRDTVRARALEILEEVDFDSRDDLLRDGFVYTMVIEHEHQHEETILQTLQLMKGGYRPELPERRPAREVIRDMIAVPAGAYPIGTDVHAPYHNEHPRHEVRLGAFEIDRFPVTCGDYQRFIEDGGYRRRELWSEAGWEWRSEAGIEAPKHWRRGQEGGWTTDRFGHVVEVEPDLPVMHVCYHEADAYSRWAGKRLPTEFEWEVAAAWDPSTGRARKYPWGDDPWTPERANLDQQTFGCAPVGAYPAGVSAFGCEQMVGDVWEWTSSDFMGYPGFTSFPYKEYSEVFFGTDYKVLRGASWAARPSVARITMRNWDYPIRRQIFAGFRCARDAE